MVHAFAVDFARDGLRGGIMVAPWVAATGSIVFALVFHYCRAFFIFCSIIWFKMQGAMVAKREELARFINLIASDWDIQQKAEGGGPQQSTKVGKLFYFYYYYYFVCFR